MTVDWLQVGEITVFALPDGNAELNSWPMAPELDGNNPLQLVGLRPKLPPASTGRIIAGESTTTAAW